MTQNFDRRKALETFGSYSVFFEAIQAYAAEVKRSVAKLDQATKSFDRKELLSGLSGLESGLRYLHAEPALRTLRNLRASAKEKDLQWEKVSEEVGKLTEKLSTLLIELREGLEPRTVLRSDD